MPILIRPTSLNSPWYNLPHFQPHHSRDSFWLIDWIESFDSVSHIFGSYCSDFDQTKFPELLMIQYCIIFHFSNLMSQMTHFDSFGSIESFDSVSQTFGSTIPILIRSSSLNFSCTYNLSHPNFQSSNFQSVCLARLRACSRILEKANAAHCHNAKKCFERLAANASATDLPDLQTARLSISRQSWTLDFWL